MIGRRRRRRKNRKKTEKEGKTNWKEEVEERCVVRAEKCERLKMGFRDACISDAPYISEQCI